LVRSCEIGETNYAGPVNHQNGLYKPLFMNIMVRITRIKTGLYKPLLLIKTVRINRLENGLYKP
jgi:hypothetical protein